jgi:phosphonate transport system ATP-binding protein
MNLPAVEKPTVHPVVSLQDVRCPTGGPLWLQIKHLQINPGERVAIVGPNGAGKSTLLRLLSGFARTAEGRVEVLGRPMHESLSTHDMRRLRCEVGQIMQNLHPVERLNVLENVLIGCLGRIRGWRGWTRRFAPTEVAAAQAALLAVGLLSRAEARADALSGGERQKVALARLLLQRPRLILADEPTAALDPQATRDVCQLLVAASQGATLVSVIHQPELLPLLADRVIGMKNGQIDFDLPLAKANDASLAALYMASSPQHVDGLTDTEGAVHA